MNNLKGALIFAKTGEVYVDVPADVQAQWNLSGIALLSPREVVVAHLERPKKPPNAFFLYKAAKRKEFKESNQRHFNRNMGQMWKSESDEVKEEFRRRAKEIARVAKAELEAEKWTAERRAGGTLAAEARPKL